MMGNLVMTAIAGIEPVFSEEAPALIPLSRSADQMMILRGAPDTTPMSTTAIIRDDFTLSTTALLALGPLDPILCVECRFRHSLVEQLRPRFRLCGGEH